MKIIHKKLLNRFALIISVVFFTPLVLAGNPAAGKAVYDGKGACAGCHGAGGAGDGAAAVAFNPRPANFTSASFRLDTDKNGQPGSDTDIANVIKYGGAKYGGNVGMPGRADFSAAEVNDLVAYIRSMKK